MRINDSVIVDSDLVEESLTSTSNRVRFQQYMNLTYLAIESRVRLQDLSRSNLRTINQSNPSILQINLLTESTIATLLSSSLIRSIDTPTPHYLRHREKNSKKLPSLSYLDETSLGHIRVWGGEYGSLSYCLHLLANTEHYLSPQMIGDICIKYYLSLMGLVKDWELISNGALLNYLDSRPELIYEESIRIITSNRYIYQAYKTLTELSEWIPRMVSYYNNFLRNKESLTKEEEFLTEIGRLLLSNGIGEDQLELGYELMHQSLPESWNSIYDSLVSLRNRSPSNPSNELTLRFNEILLPNTIKNLLVISNNLIDTYLVAPLGFNGYLVLVAIALLSRAFSATHLSNNSLSSVPFLTMSNEVLNLLRPSLVQAYEHLFYAGYCLKKTSIRPIRVIGTNLILLSKQALPDNPKDLLL